MNLKNHILSIVIILILTTINKESFAQNTIDIKDLYIRDPYIITDKANERYILYRSKSVKTENNKLLGGVEAFESKDLKNWIGPKQVFQAPEENWIHGAVWAPEVHQYKGKYYLFATMNSDRKWKEDKANWPPFLYRSVQIYKSDNPFGPFVSFSKDPHLAKENMTLDGTLWVENGTPYMVYCHEWVQINDGTMELIQLSKDLSKTIGKPKTLFKASEAKWSTGTKHQNQEKSYVTDGCFLYKTKSGKLLMIWSSFYNGNYAIGIAKSKSGSIKGPWIQEEKPLFEKNGGHGMIFKDLKDQLYVILHGPNSPAGSERALLFPIEEKDDTLVIKTSN